MHETLHILGFASRIGFTGGNNAFSQYDIILRSQISGNQQGVLTTTNTGGPCADDAINCWRLAPQFANLTALQIAVDNNCVGPEPHIVVGGVPVANGQANLAASLSHLNTSMTCGGQPHVMAPGIGIGPGSERRVLTAGERGILCEMRYSLNNQIGCAGCYNIAHSDGRNNTNAPCCFKTYFACAGETLILTEDELLCNDVGIGPLGTGRRITRIWIGGALSNIVPQPIGNGQWQITIPPNFNDSKLDLQYTVRGCNCRLHTARVEIFVDQQCTPPCPAAAGTCDNLICSGNFENFTNTTAIESRLGWPVMFRGAEAPGSPDIIVSPTGNHFLFMGNFNPNREAVNLPLRDCVPPGCSLRLEMDISSATTSPAQLEIWGSTGRPCNITVVGAPQIAHNCGTANATTCSPTNLFLPVCGPVVPAVPNLGTNNNPIFQPSGPVVWANNSDQEICFLTLVPSGGNVVVDNIVVRRTCEPTISVVPSHNGQVCPGTNLTLRFTVCANEVPGHATSGINLTLNLPNGLTLVGGNPNVTLSLAEGICQDIEFQVFVANGLAINTPLNVTLSGTATGICENANVESSLTMLVEECVTPKFTCPCKNIAGSLNVDAGDVTPNNPIGGTSILQTDIPSMTTAGLDGYRVLSKPCVAIRGRLIIDNNYKLEIIFGDLKMQPGAEIVVKNGAALKITASTLRGCVQMWRGITVEPGGTLVTDGVIIQDAQFAVKAVTNVGLGVTLVINKTKFEKDHVGIFMPDGGVNRTYPNSFFFNEFRGQNLLPSFDNINNFQQTYSYAGMIIERASIPSIGRNVFEDLRNGLIARNALLFNITLCDFRDIVGTFDPTFIVSLPPNLTGLGINATSSSIWVNTCTFNNMFRAIHTSATATQVRSNTMDFVHTGIVAAYPDFRAVVITGNNIRFSHHGIRCFSNGPASLDIGDNPNLNMYPTVPGVSNRIAIELKGFGTWRNARVYNNTITLDEEGDAIEISGCGGIRFMGNIITLNRGRNDFNFTGFDISNSSGNIVTDNMVTGVAHTLGYSISASQNGWYCSNSVSGADYGTRFFFGCGGTRFRENTLSSLARGLEIGSGTVIGTQARANNMWANSYTDFGARFWGSPFDAGSSRFFVQNTNPPMSPPYWPPTFSPSDWFGACVPFFCSNLPICPSDTEIPPVEEDPNPDPLDEHEQRVISEDYLSQSYGEMLQFEEGRRLYARLQMYPELRQGNQQAQTYYTSTSAGVIGAFHEIQADINDLWRPTASLEVASHLVDSVLAVKAENIARLDSLLEIVETAYDSTTLLTEKQQVVFGLAEEADNWLNNKLALTEEQMAKIPVALGSVASVSVVSQLETNLKTIQRIYLQTVAQGIFKLSNSQKAAVAWVGWQCPGEGGNAVYWARSLYLSLVNGTVVFDDEYLCGEGAIPRDKQDQNVVYAGKIAMYPNPTSAVLTIDRSAEPEQTNQEFLVRLVDVTGRNVMESGWQAGDATVELSTASIPNGMYFCIILEGKRLIAKQKIVIQH